MPINVTRPPRIEAKESGIKVAAADRLAFLAACRSTGISNARAPTLFITADKAADTPDMTKICDVSDRAQPVTARAMISTAPEFDRPRLMMRTIAMTIVAGWPKPAKARSAGTTPATTATRRAPKAIIS